jgi:tellurium resistance protein TerD
MSVILTKGSNVILTKQVPGLKRVRIGLGWKPNETDTGEDFDLDVTAFGLKIVNEKPVIVGRRNEPDYMVFYNNPESLDKAMKHDGDDTTGQGDQDQFGDNERIRVDLTKLNPEVEQISFIVTIDQAKERNQNFGMVPFSHVAIYNDEDNTEIARYDLDEDFSVETAVQFGTLYRNKHGEWAFKAVGAGYKLGLRAFVEG